MSNRSKIIRLSVLALICLLTITPMQSSAALVWTEYFDELDADIWTYQSCQIIDGQLRGTHADHASAVILYRESTVAVGTWKFELNETGEWGEELDICRFWILSPLQPEVPDWEYYALSIVHAGGAAGQRLSYTIEKYVDNNPKVILDSYLGEAMETTVGTFHQFMITRDAGGQITVYLNSTLIMQATDTALDSTGWFGFYTWDDWALDNIEVYDTIETGLNLPLVLSIGAGGVIIVAAILIYQYKRR
ncbi:MAG: hypothetical protein ACFFE6_04020 [Candidatus Thorarchaeota archaeon]